jgi:type VI protein secretion system component VasK
MKSFLDGGRRQRGRERFRSKFAGSRTGWGGRKLIRYRRNRALMAREFTSFALWCAIAVSLVLLARTMWRVGTVHFTDQQTSLRLGLPAIAIVACLGSLWRARRALREFLDIRREQAQLTAELKAAVDESESP